MTFTDTMKTLGFALLGVVLILADFLGMFLYLQFGQMLMEISPWTLLIYIPFCFALLFGFVIALIWISNRIEDSIGDGDKQPEQVEYDDEREDMFDDA